MVFLLGFWGHLNGQEYSENKNSFTVLLLLLTILVNLEGMLVPAYAERDSSEES